jgi:hypothetical protein
MLTINNTAGAQIFTTATVYIFGQKHTVLRSLGEVSVSEMTDYLKNVFDGFATNHLGTTELVIGNGRFVDIGNGVTIETDVDYIDGGIVNCYTMKEWEDAIKRASSIAKVLKEDE